MIDMENLGNSLKMQFLAVSSFLFVSVSMHEKNLKPLQKSILNRYNGNRRQHFGPIHIEFCVKKVFLETLYDLKNLLIRPVLIISSFGFQQKCLFFQLLWPLCEAQRTPTISYVSPNISTTRSSTIDMDCSILYGTEYPVLWMKIGVRIGHETIE